MDMQSAIRAVTEHRHLGADEMTAVMRTVMTGEATASQIGGFLVGLRMKGETVEEIAAAAGVMRALATPVKVDAAHLVDTCGTGGDGAGTFNISTTSAFIAAGAGARVAKHGNRSVSSRSGSADVLEAAGIALDLTPAQVARCVEEAGVGFLFAPMHHGAMKHAIGPRREMGVRTIFNILGPLTNPAGAPHQVIGVFSDAWVEPVARVLGRLGSRHVLVVHAEDGLDEISIAGETRVAEWRDGALRTYDVTPESLGVARGDLSALRAQSPEHSLEIMRSVLSGTPGPTLDVALLNAGAAIYAADLATSLGEGIEAARTSVEQGAAMKALDGLVGLCHAFKGQGSVSGAESP